MFTSLEIFQSAHKMAVHAGQKQAVIAKNIAHADTPGFKAMMVQDLEDASKPPEIRMSRAGHISSPLGAETYKTSKDMSAEISPNGNSVSLEMETLKSIEAERQHSRAMTVYQSALNILRSSIGRGR